MKRYIKPELDVMFIKAEDIIQTSGELIQAVNGVETTSITDGGAQMVDKDGNVVTEITMSVFD